MFIGDKDLDVDGCLSVFCGYWLESDVFVNVDVVETGDRFILNVTCLLGCDGFGRQLE